MNANEACHWMLMRKCLPDPDATYLNTGYTDTDADLCIRIMSLCCGGGTLKNGVDSIWVKNSRVLR